MEQPHPILVLGKDDEIIALYDPSIIGGEDVQHSYRHTRAQMDLARKEGRMTPKMYGTSIECVENAKKKYLASLSDYDQRETALQINLGDMINEEGLEEIMFEAMNDAKEISSGDINMVRNMRSYNQALRTLKRQSVKLEKITSRLGAA